MMQNIIITKSTSTLPKCYPMYNKGVNVVDLFCERTAAGNLDRKSSLFAFTSSFFLT